MKCQQYIEQAEQNHSFVNGMKSLFNLFDSPQYTPSTAEELERAALNLQRQAWIEVGAHIKHAMHTIDDGQE